MSNGASADPQDEGTERVADLVARWQNGDQTAATEMFNRYVGSLLGVARNHLSSRLAPKFDPEDVVQSAYRSFFVGIRDGRYTFSHGHDLWRLLVVITLRKLHHQVRHNAAQRRASGRERSLEQGTAEGIEPALLARGPSPLDAVALIDEVEQLMRHLDPISRTVLELRLQGHQLEEIATQTGHTQYVVRRILDATKARLRSVE